MLVLASTCTVHCTASTGTCTRAVQVLYTVSVRVYTDTCTTSTSSTPVLSTGTVYTRTVTYPGSEYTDITVQ